MEIISKRMTEIVPEVAFAEALLSVEPPKRRNGSQARRDWLSLVLQTQIFIMKYKLDAEKFQRHLLYSNTEGL